jgi:DNA-binding MarR family transcriptional regulator
MATPSIADTYFSIPELMRVARGAYKRAVDVRLSEGGMEDLPTSSGYLLAYLADNDEAIPEKIEGLGIKQRSLRQLVDTLVLRGYLARDIDPTDGTASLTLTERGRAANDASFEGCNYVDRALESRLSETEMSGLRRGLIALGEIKQSINGPVIRRGLPGQ